MLHVLERVEARVRTFTVMPDVTVVKAVVDDVLSVSTTEYCTTLSRYAARARHARDEELVWQIVASALEDQRRVVGSDTPFVAFIAVALARRVLLATGGAAGDAAMMSEVLDALPSLVRSVFERGVVPRCVKGGAALPLSAMTRGVGARHEADAPLLRQLLGAPAERPAVACDGLAVCLAVDAVGALMADGALVPHLRSLDSGAAHAYCRQAVNVVSVHRASAGASAVVDGVCVLAEAAASLGDGLQCAIPDAWRAATGRPMSAAVVLLKEWSPDVLLDLRGALASDPHAVAVVVVDGPVGGRQLRQADGRFAVVAGVGTAVMWRLALQLGVVPHADATAEALPAESVFDDVVELYDAAARGRRCRALTWCACRVRVAEAGVSDDQVSARSSLRSVTVSFLPPSGAADGAVETCVGWPRHVSVIVAAPSPVSHEALLGRFWSNFHRALQLLRSGVAFPSDGFADAVVVNHLRALAPPPSPAEYVAREALGDAVADYLTVMRLSADGDAEAAAGAADVSRFEPWGTAGMSGVQRSVWHTVCPVPPLHDRSAADGCDTITLADVASWECLDERVAAYHAGVRLCRTLLQTAVARVDYGAYGAPTLAVM